MTLPPLPENPAGSITFDQGPYIVNGIEIGRLQGYAEAWSADQVHAYAIAYAQAAVLAERAECAKLCDVMAQDQLNSRDERYMGGMLASAIRARGE